MSKIIVLLLLVSVVAVAESPRQAALEFLIARGTPGALDQTIEMMIDQAVKAQPKIKSQRAELKRYYETIIGFEVLKKPMIELYLREFTPNELNHLTAFYRTPLGKKLVQVENKLAPAVSEMVQAQILKLSRKAKP